MNYNREEGKGEMRRFLGFLAFSFLMFYGANSFAGSYSCPTYAKYTSCNSGYYLSDCGTTYDGHTVSSPSTGNSCKACSTAGNGYTCDGGAVCPRTGTITITLKKNNGSGTIKNNAGTTYTSTTDGSMTCTPGATVSLPSWSSAASTNNTTNITRSDYIFKGWATGSSATSGSTSITCPDADTIYYAAWKFKTSECTACSATHASCTIGVSNNACSYTTSCETGYGNIQNGGAYNASCSANPYEITLNDSTNGGSGGSGKIYTTYNTNVYKDNGRTQAMSTSANAVTKPSKTGYTFNGYYSQSSGGTLYINGNGLITTDGLDAGKGYTENKIWYAQFSNATYNVTYSCGDGSGTPPTDSTGATYGNSYTPKNNTCTRTGYTFAGWHDGSTVRPAGTAFTWNYTADKTFTAQWTPITYNITYNLNGGTNYNNAPSEYNITTSTITLGTPTHSNASFDSWYTDSSFSNAITQIAKGSTGNKTLYAKWNCNSGYTGTTCGGTSSYSVTYSCGDGGGTAPTDSTGATYSNSYTPKANTCTRTGYTFAGWKVSGTSDIKTSAFTWNYTESKVFTAQWTANSYNCAAGKYLQASDATCQDCPAGKYCTGSGSPYTYNGSDQGITGDCDANSFSTGGASSKSCTSCTTQTFDCSGTDTNSTSTCPDGTNKANATATSQAFSQTCHYTTSNAGSTSSSACTGSATHNQKSYSGKTCYVTSCAAGYTKSPSTNATSCVAATYTVAFDANGGTGGQSASVTATYNASMPSISSTAPTRTGYTFTGWYDNENTKYYNASGASAHTWDKTYGATLYAGWSANSYTISYSCGTGTSGSAPSGTSVSFNNTVSLASNTCSKEGYTFSGWNDGSQIIPANAPFAWQYTTNKTFTATFSNGYSCPSYVRYTSCSQNYYLNGTSAGNACVACPSGTGWQSTTSANNASTSCTCPSGWHKTGSANSITAVVSGDTCTVSEVTVTLNKNGGSGTFTLSSSGTLTSNPSGTADAILTCTPGATVSFSSMPSRTNVSDVPVFYTQASDGSTWDMKCPSSATTYYLHWLCDLGYSVDGTPSGSTYPSSNQACTPISRNITCTSADGVSGVPLSVKTGDTSITKPTKPGYSFNGASLDCSGTGTPHWVCNDGCSGNSCITIGSNGNINDIEDSGSWQFEYWLDNMTAAHDSYYNYSDDIPFVCNWTKNTYNVTYSCGDGSGTEPTDSTGATYGDSYTPKTNTCTRTGYTFTGWKVSGTSDVKTSAFTWNYTENKTLTAQWTINTFTVVYDAGGGTGTAPQSQSCTYGGSNCIAPSNTFTLDGSDFTGWACTSSSGSCASATYAAGDNLNTATNVNGATLTLTAQWQTNSITLKWQPAYGTAPANTSCVFGGTFVASSAPTVTGRSFTSWKVNGNTLSAGETYNCDYATLGLYVGTATMSGEYNAINYDINYNTNGGTNSSYNPLTYNIDSSNITLYSPNRPHSSFVGWYGNADFTGSKIESIPAGSTGTVNLYAKWNCDEHYHSSNNGQECTLDTYQVTYKCGDGTGVPPSQATATYSQGFTPATNTCTRENWQFSGWLVSGTSNIKAAGTEFSWAYTSNKDFTAQWVQTAGNCTNGQWFDSSTNACQTCPPGYTSDLGATSEGECYTSCEASCVNPGVDVDCPKNSLACSYDPTAVVIGTQYHNSNVCTPIGAGTCPYATGSIECKSRFYVSGVSCLSCATLGTGDYLYTNDNGVNGESSCFAYCPYNCTTEWLPTVTPDGATCSVKSNQVNGIMYYPTDVCLMSAPCKISSCSCGEGYTFREPEYDTREDGDIGSCEPNTYTITLDDNGGSGGNGTVYEKYNNWYRLSENGANVNTIAAPTLENWIFRGYYDDPTNGSIVIDSEGNLPSATYFKSDTTLYAHWVRGEYICVAGKAADNSTPCDSGYYCPGTKVPDGTENSEEAGCRRKCPTDVKGGDIRSASNNTTISGCYTVRNNVTLSDQTGSGDETCYYNQAINLYEDLSCNIAIKKCIAGRYRELESSTTCAVVGTGAYSPANDTAKHLCSELDGADETTTTETTTSASAEDCYNQCPNISIANGTRVAKHAIVHYNGTSIPACEYTTECNTGYQPSGETCIPKIIPVTLNHNGGTSSLNKIYLKYATGWYTTQNAAESDKITQPIAMPNYPGKACSGYFSDSSQLIVGPTGALTTTYTVFSDGTPTITASWETKPIVTCAAGTYYTGYGTTCTDCPAGSYCGGTETIQDIEQVSGLVACPTDAGKYTPAKDANGDNLTVSITSAAKSGDISDCYATNVAYSSPTNNGAGSRTCHYDEGAGSYTATPSNIHIITCKTGYYLKDNNDPDCTEVGNGYYSPDIVTERKPCPNRSEDNTITTFSSTSGDVTQCYRGNIWYEPEGGHSGHRRNCYHRPNENDTNITTGYTYNCVASVIVTCDAGYYDDGSHTITTSSGSERDCVQVEKGYYSPEQSFFTDEDVQPDMANPGSSTKAPECPLSGTTAEKGASRDTQCYKTCPASITIANGTTSVVSATVFYTGSAYPECTYNATCNTGYTASGNGTKAPSCVANISGKISINDDLYSSAGTIDPELNVDFPVDPKGVYVKYNTGVYSDAAVETSAETLTSEPAFTGYTFNGLYTDDFCAGTKVYDAGTGFKTNILTMYPTTGQTAWLYACYDPNKYDVTYSCGTGDGGTAPASAQATYDANFTPAANTCTKTGYTFAKWNDGSADRPAGTAFKWTYATDRTLTATWTANKYNVNYSCGTGDGGTTPASAQATYDANFTPAENTCTKSGYDFDGWNDGSEDRPAGTAFKWQYTTTKTLTAQWSQNKYDVTYSCGTGTGTAPAAAKATYDANFTPAENTCTKTGYTFAGWNDGSEDRPAGTAFKWTYASAKTFTAQWIANEYDVTYSCGTGDGGTAPADAQATYDANFTPAFNTCTKTGYTFAGWNDGSEDRPAGTAFKWTYASDKTFTAQWTANKYDVTYSCGTGTGTAPAATKATYDANFTPATNTCTNTGYDFAGWNDGSVDRPAGTAFKWTYIAAKTFTAQWTAQASVVTLDANGGVAGATATINATYDVAMPAIAAANLPKRTGYTFAGFYDTSSTTGGTKYYDANGTSAHNWDKTGAQRLWARWTANKYTVDYSCGTGDGGTTPTGTQATYDSEFTPAANTCTKTGYTFAGWNDGSTVRQAGTAFTWTYAADRTLTATWTANKYNVTYSCGDGATGVEPEAAIATYDAEFMPAANNSCAKVGYTFDGWNDGTEPRAAGESFTWQYTTDRTFTAQWSQDSYVVTYDCGTGTGSVPANGEPVYDDYFTPASNTCTKTGYTFTGWNDGEVLRPAGTPFKWQYTSGRTFTAQWQANKYNVTYSCGTGTGNAPSGDEATYDSNFTPAVNTCSKVGYTFAGWHDGSVIKTPGTAFKWQYITDKTFTAQWTKNTYTVTYTCGEGTGSAPANDTATYDDNFAPAENTCTKVGYTFAGWKDGETIRPAGTDFKWTYTSPKTFIALWTANKYTVTYACGTNGGTAPESAEVTYDDTFAPAASTCTKIGYTFAGWNDGGPTIRPANTGFTWKYASDKTFTATWTPNVYKINLNDDSATIQHGAPATLYMKYDTGWYTAVDTNESSRIEALSTKPTRKGYVFAGYKLGSVEVIDALGKFKTNSFTTTNATINVDWTPGVTDCPAGYYYTGRGIECAICPEDSYCPSRVDYTTDSGVAAGIISCPKSGSRAPQGSSMSSQCYMDLLGTYVSATQRGSGTQTCYYNAEADEYIDACINKRITSCIAGYYFNAEETSVSEPDCVPVGEDHYSLDGDISRTHCPANYPLSNRIDAPDDGWCYATCLMAQNATTMTGKNYKDATHGHCSIVFCEPGYYLPDGHDGECKQCEEGFYCDGTDGLIGNGSTSCEAATSPYKDKFTNWKYSAKGSSVITDCYTQCYERDVEYGHAVPDNATEHYGQVCTFTGESATHNPCRVDKLGDTSVYENGVCVESECHSNYEMKNGICQLCNNDHVTTFEATGNCIVAQCDNGYHPHGTKCDPDVASCTIPNAETATSIWNHSTKTFGICTVKECKDGYHIESNACVPDNQVCAMPNGTGKRVWNGNTWDACVATSCDPGYIMDANDQCTQCDNMYEENGDRAVSSYVNGCEVASCMYQGEKYELKNGVCVPICQPDSDETGEKYWDYENNKCVYRCKDGYMPE